MFKKYLFLVIFTVSLFIIKPIQAASYCNCTTGSTNMGCLETSYCSSYAGGTCGSSCTPASVSKDKYGLYDTAYKAGLMETNISKKNGLQIAADILGIALSFLGIVFFGIMLYAGLRWMTALGDSQKVETSKTMLESAGIGLIIILASYAIATYVFNYLGIG